jgi:hypothetical protein
MHGQTDIIELLSEDKIGEVSQNRDMTSTEKRTKKRYNAHEKRKILARLDDERRMKNRREEIRKKRVENKEVFKFGTRKFYKFLEMEREYYIEVDVCHRISHRPEKVELFYRTLDTLDKKYVLIRCVSYNENFFISHNQVRVYYKQYKLQALKK